MSNQKSVQVRCRLSSATEGSAAQVALTPEEHQAASHLALRYGWGSRGLSTFIRHLGEKAAGDSAGFSNVHALLHHAAQKAGMSIGSWLRMCLIRALDQTKLAEQLTRVAEFRAKSEKLQYEMRQGCLDGPALRKAYADPDLTRALTMCDWAYVESSDLYIRENRAEDPDMKGHSDFMPVYRLLEKKA